MEFKKRGSQIGCQNQLTLQLYQKFQDSEFHDLGFFLNMGQMAKDLPFQLIVSN